MEVCFYYDGGVVVLFVILVDVGNGLYVRIVEGCVFSCVGIGFILI